jgi:hypothetical protein
MRNEGGFEVIKKAIEKLGLKHKEHIAAYGEGNERRLTGRHETADINTFSWVRKQRKKTLGFSSLDSVVPSVFSSFKRLSICSSFSGRFKILYGRGALNRFCVESFEQGVANRGASIRVGRDTEKEGKGIDSV